MHVCELQLLNAQKIVNKNNCIRMKAFIWPKSRHRQKLKPTMETYGVNSLYVDDIICKFMAFTWNVHIVHHVRGNRIWYSSADIFVYLIIFRRIQ
jgi:hypothetical protein